MTGCLSEATTSALFGGGKDALTRHGSFSPNAASELPLLLPAPPTENRRFIHRHRSHRVTDNSLTFRETQKRLSDTGFDFQNVELNVRFFPFREMNRGRSICFSRLLSNLNAQRSTSPTGPCQGSQIDDDVANRLRAANEEVAFRRLVQWLRSIDDLP
jgi:hypothetical protein